MTERILEEFEHALEVVELKPATGGVFEVYLDTERVYSKKRTGKHPEPDDLLRDLRERIGGQ